MEGITAKVSLLIEHGHTEARFYPIGMVVVEAEHVRVRVNAIMATETTLMTMAISANFSKPASSKLRALLKGLKDDG